MRRLVAVLVLAVGLVAPVAAHAEPREAVIVHLRGDAPPPAGEPGAVAAALRARTARADDDVRALLARHGATVRPLWILNALAVSAPPAALAAVAAHPDVARVTPDATVAAPPEAPPAPATDPAATRVGAPDLWALGLRGRGVVIARVDTGVDATHPALASRRRGGASSWFDPFADPSTSSRTPEDASGHGTKVLGIALAVAPEATWIAARIFSPDEPTTESRVHAAYQWLLDPDGDPRTDDAPDVVNSSWALDGPGCHLTYLEDIRALRAAGILPVFAAGNGDPWDLASASPANNPGALSVGSLDDADRASTFSRRDRPCDGGRSPALMAPGEGVEGLAGGAFAGSIGTSLAAPLVSGGLALLLGAHPGLTVEAQEAALLASAADLGDVGVDALHGHGRLDLLAAHRRLLAAAPPPPPAPPAPDPAPAPTPGPPPPPVPAPAPPPPAATPPPPAQGVAGALARSLDVRAPARATRAGLRRGVRVAVTVPTRGSRVQAVLLRGRRVVARARARAAGRARVVLVLRARVRGPLRLRITAIAPDGTTSTRTQPLRVP